MRLGIDAKNDIKVTFELYLYFHAIGRGNKRHPDMSMDCLPNNSLGGRVFIVWCCYALHTNACGGGSVTDWEYFIQRASWDKTSFKEVSVIVTPLCSASGQDEWWYAPYQVVSLPPPPTCIWQSRKKKALCLFSLLSKGNGFVNIYVPLRTTDHKVRLYGVTSLGMPRCNKGQNSACIVL